MSIRGFKLDHVVVVVPSLIGAIEQYQSLGFTVSPGGDNGPTHNALISFEDGCYIELISMRSKLLRGMFKFFYQTKLINLFKPLTSQLKFRLMCWFGGPNGIRDWCIRQTQLEPLPEVLSCNNIRMSKVEKFSRSKPNLDLAEWLLAAPLDQRLPFLIEDITDVGARIPAGDACLHGNGCRGISSLFLDQDRYSSISESLAMLTQCDAALGHNSGEIDIKFMAQQGSQIVVELVGIGSNVAILEVSSNQCPEIILR